MQVRYVPNDESRGCYGYAVEFDLRDVIAVERSKSTDYRDWCVVHLRGGPNYEFSREESRRFLAQYDEFKAAKAAAADHEPMVKVR